MEHKTQRTPLKNVGMEAIEGNKRSDLGFSQRF
jgi:hypothetical protein